MDSAAADGVQFMEATMTECASVASILAHRVTDDQLRAAGYTANARRYPLSNAAVRWVCRFNGITVTMAPHSWFYAPNEAMRRYVEDRAADA